MIFDNFNNSSSSTDILSQYQGPLNLMKPETPTKKEKLNEKINEIESLNNNTNTTNHGNNESIRPLLRKTFNKRRSMEINEPPSPPIKSEIKAKLPKKVFKKNVPAKSPNKFGINNSFNPVKAKIMSIEQNNLIKNNNNNQFVKPNLNIIKNGENNSVENQKINNEEQENSNNLSITQNIEDLNDTEKNLLSELEGVAEQKDSSDDNKLEIENNGSNDFKIEDQIEQKIIEENIDLHPKELEFQVEQYHSITDQSEESHLQESKDEKIEYSQDKPQEEDHTEKNGDDNPFIQNDDEEAKPLNEPHKVYSEGDLYETDNATIVDSETSSSVEVQSNETEIDQHQFIKLEVYENSPSTSPLVNKNLIVPKLGLGTRTGVQFMSNPEAFGASSDRVYSSSKLISPPRKFVPKLGLNKILTTNDLKSTIESNERNTNPIPSFARKKLSIEHQLSEPLLRTRVTKDEVTVIMDKVTKERKFELEFVFTHNEKALTSLIKIQAVSRKLKAKKILKQLSENKKKRGYILKEILSSEKIYIDNLKLCLQEFGEPLKQFIDSKNWKTIFAKVEIIMNVNIQLYTKINERIEEQGGENIGDIFVEMGVYLKVYTTYVNHYNTILDLLNELTTSHPQFKEFLLKMKEQPVLKGIELPAFLIMPIQRLPRYVLLIQDLIKVTDCQHKDSFNLSQALKTLQEITDYVNEQKRNFENTQLMSKIQKKILNCPNIMEPSRRFLTEGYLYNLDKKMFFYYFLFSDCLVCARVNKAFIKKKKKRGEKEKDSAIEDINLSFKFKEFIPISGCELKDLSPEEFKPESLSRRMSTDDMNIDVTLSTSISITKEKRKVRYHPQGMMEIITPQQILRLAATSPEEKVLWLRNIDNNWSKIIDNERTRKLNIKPEKDEVDLSAEVINPILTGQLWLKVGGSWKRAWCKITHQYLYFYSGPQATVASSAIYILTTTLELAKKKKFGYSFYIRNKDNTFHQLGATDLNTIFTWFKCIRALVRSAFEIVKKTNIQEKILEDDSNKQCADCEMNAPQYVNLHFGICLCTSCALIHKTFPNKDHSQIFGIREELPLKVINSVEIKNKKANDIYLLKALLKMPKLLPHDNFERRKEFIYEKYFPRN